jgi:hypothetical protein
LFAKEMERGMTNTDGREAGHRMGRIPDEQHEKDERVFASFIEAASRPRRPRTVRPPAARSNTLTPGLPPDYDTDDQGPDLIED